MFEKYEGWLYWLAFLIAIGMRMIQLGAKPLTDSEAQIAIQALHIAQGREVLIGTQPLYVLFTSVLFLLTEATNFMARLIPAFVGSLFVFAPRYFRAVFKTVPCVIISFLIAFDPGLVALSRQVGGSMLAVTFFLFAWGMWRNERSIPAGIFSGLALLSGPSIWIGLLILIVTLIILFGFQTNQTTISELRPYLTALGASLIIAGTLFLTHPEGLSAIFTSFVAFLDGWTSPSTFTPDRIFLTMLFYEPLILILAIFALIRGIRTKSERISRLGVWFGISFMIAVFFRQPSELAWAIIPLLILAGQELSRAFDIYPEERVEISIVAGGILFVVLYTWFIFSGIALNPYQQINATTIPFFGRVITIPIGLPYLSLLILIILLLFCVGLVAIGWSQRTARFGLTWSLSVFFIFYSFAASWGASGLRTPGGVELWQQDQPPVQADLLMSSIEEVSLMSRGHITSEPVAVLGINSPALEWALRDHGVQMISVLDPLEAPPIVITPFMNELGLPSAYRGQDFTWREPPAWNVLQWPDWARWIVFRQLPRETETIILWVRDDLFPDSRETIQ